MLSDMSLDLFAVLPIASAPRTAPELDRANADHLDVQFNGLERLGRLDDPAGGHYDQVAAPATFSVNAAVIAASGEASTGPNPVT